jgi:hypothetical protein
VHYRAVVRAWEHADALYHPRRVRARDWLAEYAQPNPQRHPCRNMRAWLRACRIYSSRPCCGRRASLLSFDPAPTNLPRAATGSLSRREILDQLMREWQRGCSHCKRRYPLALVLYVDPSGVVPEFKQSNR